VIDELIGHHWHHLPGDDVCELLETHPERGLGELAVRHRQTSIGYSWLTSRKGPGALRRLLAAVALMAALQALCTYAPPLNTAFGSAPLTPALWGLVLAAGLTVLIIVEIEKWAAAASARRRDGGGAR